MTIGERIRDARERGRLTQRKLAHELRVTREAISLWETGVNKCPTDKILAIAKATKVPVQWLLGEDLPEQDGNSRLLPLLGGGRVVPLIDAARAARRESPLVSDSRLCTAFPCSDDSFAVEVVDTSNAPTFEVGDRFVIDPQIAATPSRIVFAAVGIERRAMLGKLRFETAGSAKITVVAPLNTDWPSARSDVEMVDIIGPMTEHTKPVR